MAAVSKARDYVVYCFEAQYGKFVTNSQNTLSVNKGDFKKITISWLKDLIVKNCGNMNIIKTLEITVLGQITEEEYNILNKAFKILKTHRLTK